MGTVEIMAAGMDLLSLLVIVGVIVVGSVVWKAYNKWADRRLTAEQAEKQIAVDGFMAEEAERHRRALGQGPPLA